MKNVPLNSGKSAGCKYIKKNMRERRAALHKKGKVKGVEARYHLPLSIDILHLLHIFFIIYTSNLLGTHLFPVAGL